MIVLSPSSLSEKAAGAIDYAISLSADGETRAISDRFMAQSRASAEKATVARTPKVAKLDSSSCSACGFVYT